LNGFRLPGWSLLFRPRAGLPLKHQSRRRNRNNAREKKQYRLTPFHLNQFIY
jgi:hypothetical protein